MPDTKQHTPELSTHATRYRTHDGEIVENHTTEAPSPTPVVDAVSTTSAPAVEPERAAE